MKKSYLALLSAVLMATPAAHAWWDTSILKASPFKLVTEIEAEACPGVPESLLAADPQGSGGQGSKAFILKPGGPALTTTFDGLQPRGLYVVYVMARAPESAPSTTLLTLTVTEKASGQTSSWTLPVAYSPLYHASGRLYFPTPAGGTYAVSVSQPADASGYRVDSSIEPGDSLQDAPVTNFIAKLRTTPFRPLWIDRLELRDLLADVARKAVKTRRMLTTDEALSELRESFADEVAAAAGTRRPVRLPAFAGPFALDSAVTPWWPKGRSPDERQARNEQLWSLMPDYNTLYSQRSPRYMTTIGHDTSGGVLEAALAYEKTGNAEFGWDAAILLCSIALKWPALDFQTQSISQNGQGPAAPSSNLFTFSQSPGKFVYRGWSGGTTEKLVRSYDKVFDFITGNQALADAVGKHVPWVKTPADVRWLLDVYLLQVSMDQAGRDWISGTDSVKVLIPLIQGVSPVSDRMLDTGLFHMMAMNMTFRGGADDQAICSYSRDGVHYIGSVGYLGNDLLEIGDLLKQYVNAGGNARFDILNETQYPHMREAEQTLAAVNNVAGGFPLIVGDARDMRVGRTPGAAALPSRLLGGFATTILESGPATNPLARRAVGLYAGIGRGHAHQDCLNIEVFAHGCRVAPDLGGRHEGKNHGSPNMRWNKVHNVVEVDGRNFENEYAGSTVSGTGWNTAFSPRPGSQYMAHRARATSHPEVTLYSRQTALIDADDRNSYLFDVFRVRGGSVHTYCFHGGRASNDDFTVNAPLAPATSSNALEYLRKHFEGTRREGVVPDVLQADWTLEPGLQKHYQGPAGDPAARVTTRLHLFDHKGASLYTGNAFSEMYAYNFPMLYVRSAAAASNRESVFPVLLEPFAGTAFILSRRALAVKGGKPGADAPVAVEVTLAGGLTDTLFAGSGQDGLLDAGGAMQTAGRFAQVRRDSQGPALAHLAGGTELRADGIALTLSVPRYEARIETVDYAAQTFTLKGTWPARLLKGAAALIENPDHHEAFVLESLENGAGGSTRVKHEKTALYYQSTVLNANEKEGWLETEIEPPVFGCDSRFIDGTTAGNEKQDKAWKVTFEESDRWMAIGFPGYRGSFPNTMSWADLPDADKDGRKTLRLIETETRGTNRAGQVLLTLEVTRISDDGKVFYFKLPADPDYQRGGWQYAYRHLVNEDGSKTWVSLYPGSSFRWKPEGGFKAADFTDANGDGRTKLRAYVFGPGDTVSVEGFAYAKRLAADLWEIRANAPCTVELPAGGFSRVSLGGASQEFQALEAKRVDNRLVVSLSEKVLGDGTVVLKLEP